MTEAFRRIGAETAAARIEKSSRMFPFADPHLHEDQRLAWLDSIKDDPDHEFASLSNDACGDAAVFEKLAAYVAAHAGAFCLQDGCNP
jgi:hypothetical protein